MKAQPRGGGKRALAARDVGCRKWVVGSGLLDAVLLPIAGEHHRTTHMFGIGTIQECSRTIGPRHGLFRVGSARGGGLPDPDGLDVHEFAYPNDA